MVEEEDSVQSSEKSNDDGADKDHSVSEDDEDYNVCEDSKDYNVGEDDKDYNVGEDDEDYVVHKDSKSVNTSKKQSIIKERLKCLKKEVESTLAKTMPPHPLKQEVCHANEIIRLIRGIENLSICRKNLAADSLSIEATCKSNDKILEEILDILTEFKDSEDYVIIVPSRGKQNQAFDEESENMKLLPNSFSRKLTDKPNDLFTVTISVLLEIFKLCNLNLDANIRDIYYTNTALYKTPQRISHVIDDICCMLRCHRSCLHLFATDKGVVLGNMKYTCNGEEFDCSRDKFGHAIPARTNLLTSMSTNEDTAFILLVEKHSVFLRLAQDSFWKDFKCIMITGSGMPDVASRYFLTMAEKTFKRPVFGLFDSNPYGARILCTYRYGSENMSYDHASLATPGIIWLGIKTIDLETYEIPLDDKYRVEMTQNDKNECQSLFKAKYLVKNEEWKTELQDMLKVGTKTEIEALYVHGYKFLAEVYLPHRLQELLQTFDPVSEEDT